MVLATTFVCGACMLTSCSKDEKNNEPTPTPTNYNVYEVNLTAIAHDCSAPYLMIELEYTMPTASSIPRPSRPAMPRMPSFSRH